MSKRRSLTLPSSNSGRNAAEQTTLEVEQVKDSGQAVTRRASSGVLSGVTGASVSAPLTVDSIPAPYAASLSQFLDDQERADLAACEQAVEGLQRAFAAAGKALATINKARLYRETHATFPEYLSERWKISESQAYRLMDAWPVYAQLEGAGVVVLNERQARELVSTFRKYGGPATVALARAVEKHAGKTTAATYEVARKGLPAQLPRDPDQMVQVIEESTLRALPRTSPNGGGTEGPDEAGSETSPNGGGTEDGPDPRDLINEELKACVDDLTRAWDRVQRINGYGVAANDLGAAIHDANKARGLARQIIKGLTVPGAPGGEDE